MKATLCLTLLMLVLLLAPWARRTAAQSNCVDNDQDGFTQCQGDCKDNDPTVQKCGNIVAAQPIIMSDPQQSCTYYREIWTYYQCTSSNSCVIVGSEERYTWTVCN